MNRLVLYESSDSSDCEEDLDAPLETIAGNWPTFIFVQVAIDSLLVEKILQFQRSTGIHIQEIHDKHISCSRTIVLKSFQVDAFLSRMANAMKDLIRFQVNFYRIRRFRSLFKSFISFQVGKGADMLQQITSHVNSLLQDYHQEPYWKNPKFHSSIAFCFSTEVDFSHLKLFEAELLKYTFLVDTVNCNIGNRAYSWKLGGDLQF